MPGTRRVNSRVVKLPCGGLRVYTDGKYLTVHADWRTAGSYLDKPAKYNTIAEHRLDQWRRRVELANKGKYHPFQIYK